MRMRKYVAASSSCGDFPECMPSSFGTTNTAADMDVDEDRSAEPMTGLIEQRRDSVKDARSCWVCFATDEDEPGKQWTSPCQCRGATKWVHQICLQHWIDEKQRGASSVEVECPQCRYTYRITYPGRSILLLLYEHTNQIISSSSPVILATISASSLYWVSVTYGVASLSAALGRERSVRFFSDPSSSLAIVCLPLLPWGILGLKVVRLEVQVLRLWHRLLVPVICSLLKRVPGIRLLDLRPTLYTPTPVAIFPHVSRCIVGTFALPVVSCLLGWVYSHFLQRMSNFKQVLLGGGSYLLASYSAKICLEQYRATSLSREAAMDNTTNAAT